MVPRGEYKVEIYQAQADCSQANWISVDSSISCHDEYDAQLQVVENCILHIFSQEIQSIVPAKELSLFKVARISKSRPKIVENPADSISNNLYAGGGAALNLISTMNETGELYFNLNEPEKINENISISLKYWASTA